MSYIAWKEQKSPSSDNLNCLSKLLVNCVERPCKKTFHHSAKSISEQWRRTLGCLHFGQLPLRLCHMGWWWIVKGQLTLQKSLAVETWVIMPGNYRKWTSVLTWVGTSGANPLSPSLPLSLSLRNCIIHYCLARYVSTTVLESSRNVHVVTRMVCSNNIV